MNTNEVLKLALDALEINNKAWKALADSGDAGFWEAEEQPFYELSEKAITALREALAEPTSADYAMGYAEGFNDACKPAQQEPCTRVECMGSNGCIGYCWNKKPAQRTWVGLTDEEIDKTHETKVWDARRSYARAIEAKLKEKNT